MTTPAAGAGAAAPAGLTAIEIEAVAAILIAYADETLAVNALQRLWKWGAGDRQAIRAALRLSDPRLGAHIGTRPSPRLRGTGLAARETQKTELRFRAAYVINAARRIRASALPLGEAVARERPYYLAHEAARRGRQAVANRVDAAAGIYGAVLGWHTHKDDRTTPECLAADGTNFRVGVRPRIGYPGAVHRYCRCSPGPPFATIISTDDATFGIRH